MINTKDSKTLFCLWKLVTQKSFFEIYRQVWHAPSKRFASTVLTPEPHVYRLWQASLATEPPEAIKWAGRGGMVTAVSCSTDHSPRTFDPLWQSRSPLLLIRAPHKLLSSVIVESGVACGRFSGSLPRVRALHKHLNCIYFISTSQ